MKSPCLLLACAALMGSSDAFMVSPTPSKSQSALSYSSGTTLPLPDPRIGATRVMGGGRGVGGSSKSVPSSTSTSTVPGRPAHIQQVMTMEEYNKVVAAEKDQVVVVRFYAPWCRACKAMAPSYFKFTKDLEQKNVKFVDCPFTPSNADLHASLGVDSIPFVHVYHPEAGLVEKRKLSRKYYSSFEQVVKTYFEDSCDLTDCEDFSSPWEVKELATQSM